MTSSATTVPEAQTEAPEDVLESLIQELPCERRPAECLSKRKRPATWFFSHLDADSGCTWLLCDPCKRNVDRLVIRADQLNYNKVVCRSCRKLISTEDLIIRQI